MSDLAIGIACVAFLITQVHLWRVARKLIKKSEASWAQARSTIFESSKTIHDDVVKQIAESAKTSGLADAQTMIAELRQRVDSLQVGIRESFITFGTDLGKTLEGMIPKTFGGADPRAQQAAGVDARKVNQIMRTLDTGSAVGGDMIGAVNKLASFLEQLGEPALGEWLQDHPTALPQIYQSIQRNPRLASRLAQMEERMLGAPGGGNGGLQAHGGQGMSPGVNR